MIMLRKYHLIALILLPVFFFNACEEDRYTVPEAKTELQNDCIKRSLGPNIAGQNIEFVYAMALGYDAGKIISAQVEATIAGASGTYLEHRSYHTNSSGVDIPVTVGNPSETTGLKTVVTFTKDTCAAALRYFYNIPDEARGKEVSFIFSAKASTGEEISYEMGPYTIAKMDMKLDLVLSDNNLCYFSVADMAAYTATEAATKAGNIDLVYLYRSITGVTFAHALVSPAANTEYLPGITLPSGVDNNTRFWKVYNLQDRQLANLQYGIYVDDLDFIEKDFTNAPNYGINMKAEYGAWVETEDGKYRAYIFINKVDNSNKQMTVSIKRYPMK
jgi:hypothetical protein